MAVERPHEAEEHENEERWLLTYADLITLLMVFFVVMYAMSRIDVQKFEAISISLGEAFNVPPSSATPAVLPGGGRSGGDDNGRRRSTVKPMAEQAVVEKPPQSEKPAEEEVSDRAKLLTPEMAHVRSDFLDLIAQEGLQSSISVEINSTGSKLFIRLSDSLLFTPGSDVMTEQSLALMEKIARILSRSGKIVCIEGHTDNVPIHTEQFESNWQLSVSRATNVIQYLIDTGDVDPSRLCASGYGEYRPVATNDTPEGRAQNRRVEFVVHEADIVD